MSDVAAGRAGSAPPTPGAARPSARRIERRRPLPGGRAVVGGFLVAAAGVGLFGAYSGAGDGPSTSFVVVSRDVRAGERLTADDLDLVPIDMPAEQVARAFTDPGVVAGATALGSIAAGELVQVSDVAKPVGAAGTAQLSLRVAGARIPAAVKPGETVDVLVVYGTGETALVETVAAGVQVVEVSRPSDSLGGAADVVVTLAVPPDLLEPLALAASAGEVTVARTTGVRRSEGTDATDRPPSEPGRSTATTRAARSDRASASASVPGGD